MFKKIKWNTIGFFKSCLSTFNWHFQILRGTSDRKSMLGEHEVDRVQQETGTCRRKKPKKWILCLASLLEGLLVFYVKPYVTPSARQALSSWRWRSSPQLKTGHSSLFPNFQSHLFSGAFIIPFLVMLLVVGMPLLLLELALGQKLRVGAARAWYKVSLIHPLNMGGPGGSFLSFGN